MEQTYVFGVLTAALIFFVWGKWRYDLVALGTLLALVVPGIVLLGAPLIPWAWGL